MAAEQRKLLEQLMGEELMQGANAARQPKLPITSPQICRSYLVGTCPHDRFINTKGDLGPCPKVHSEALKAEYEAASEEQRKKWNFEFDYLRDMGKHIDDCNFTIDKAQRRLEKTDEEIRKTNALLTEIGELTRTITTGLQEIEVLCVHAGAVNVAVTEHFKLRQAQQLRADKERELKELSDTGGPSGHQKLQVCDVCGAYLSRLDNDRRLADHFYGKMHLGYAQMRKTYVELKEQLRDRAPPTREETSTAPRGPDDGHGGFHGGGGGGGWGGRGRGGHHRGRGGRGGHGRW